eukprot:m51a1_g8301 hypothetical protein (318) ;mRNA; f:40648-42103
MSSFNASNFVNNASDAQTPIDDPSAATRSSAPVIDESFYVRSPDATFALELPGGIVSAPAVQSSEGDSRAMALGELDEQESAADSSQTPLEAPLPLLEHIRPAFVGEPGPIDFAALFSSWGLLLFNYDALSPDEGAEQSPKAPETPLARRETPERSNGDGEELMARVNNDGLEEVLDALGAPAEESAEKPEQDDAVSESGYSADDEESEQDEESEEDEENEDDEDDASEWAPPTHRGSKRTREEVFAEEADLDEPPTKTRITGSLVLRDTGSGVDEKEQAPAVVGEAGARKRPREEACEACPESDDSAGEPPAKRRC